MAQSNYRWKRNIPKERKVLAEDGTRVPASFYGKNPKYNPAKGFVGGRAGGIAGGLGDAIGRRLQGNLQVAGNAATVARRFAKNESN